MIKCVDLNKQAGNKVLQDERVQELLNSGKTWSEMWMLFSQKSYQYDKHFTDVSNYAMNYNIEQFMNNK